MCGGSANGGRIEAAEELERIPPLVVSPFRSVPRSSRETPYNVSLGNPFHVRIRRQGTLVKHVPVVGTKAGSVRDEPCLEALDHQMNLCVLHSLYLLALRLQILDRASPLRDCGFRVDEQVDVLV